MTALVPVTLAVLAACSNEPIVEQQAPRPPEISVGLASTRLGADCAGGEEHVVAEATTAKGDAKPAPRPQRIPCEQTAVHLSIRSPASAAPTAIELQRVELLDRNGRVLEVLHGHSPSRWGTDRFVAWDERTVPGQTMAVGYKLSSPDWSKIPDANNRSFKMRVIVRVGDSTRTLEATAELRIEDTSNIVT